MIKTKRNYKKEYAAWSDSQTKNNRIRQKARVTMGLKPGDKREVDHIKSLSKGGSNTKKNLRVVSKKTNRKKGAA